MSGPRAKLAGALVGAVLAGHAGAQGPAPVTLDDVIVSGRTAPAHPLDHDAPSASRLGLTAREVPAAIEILDRRDLHRDDIHSVTDAATRTVGVTAGDFPAEPAAFSMRGFTGNQITTLYNGIRIGPANMTNRVTGTANLERIEFLKGSASLMSGEGASGGAINLVTRRPHAGPVEHEVHASYGSFNTVHTGFGSGGSTRLTGLDYRIDLNRASSNGFVDDTPSTAWHVSGGLDWRAAAGLKLFVAAEYKRDKAKTYWGTPLVSSGGTGIGPVSGLVSGTHVSAYNGTNLGAVTLDGRTLRTNYNVIDNRSNAEETWVRGGVEWAPRADMLVRNQVYRYDARREWFNNEIIAFNAGTGLVDRERFFVAHDQTLVGDKAEWQWDARLAGRHNRLVLAAEWSRLDFHRPGAANFPGDSVTLADPDRGTYGALTTQRQTAAIDTLAVAVEDRLRLTPRVALVGGLRHESIALDRTSTNAAGADRSGFPFSSTWRPTTGRTGVTWDLTNALTLYAQYATGADVSANNLFLLGPTQPPGLTRARTLEAGAKHRFLDGHGTLTAAVFAMRRSNVYAAQGGQQLALAGEQRSRGAELAASVRAPAGWRLWANLAWTHARYHDYDFAGGSYSGNTPPNVPAVVANAGGALRIATAYPVEVGLAMRHVGDRFHSDANTVTLESYTIADAFLAVDVARGVTATLRVRNLADRRYVAWSDPFYPDQVLVGAPRGVELGIRATFR